MGTDNGWGAVGVMRAKWGAQRNKLIGEGDLEERESEFEDGVQHDFGEVLAHLPL